MSSQYKVNCTFVKRLFNIFVISTKPCTAAFFLFFLLIPVCFLEQFGIYYVGLLPSKFYNVLESKDSAGFKDLLIVAFTWIAAIVFIKSCKSFTTGALYIQWRWNLTSWLHMKYFCDKTFYDLNCLNNGIDNPDMRITQDVDKLLDTLQAVIVQLLVFPGVVCYYTYKCAHVMGWLGPVCIYSYFLISCIMNKFLMNPIVREVFSVEQKEGYFRYIHVMLRKYAESAAFIDAEDTEYQAFQRSITSILASKQVIVMRQLFLNIGVNFCDYLGAIFSYMIIAIPIFSGKFDNEEHLGSVISKNAFVAMYLVNTFSSMIDISEKIAGLAGFTHRVGELIDFINSRYCKELNDSGTGSFTGMLRFDSKTSENISNHSCSTILKLNSVTIKSPFINRTFVKNLFLSVSEGSNVLITGPPGCGKTSILRAIKALWTPFCGEIEAYSDVMFLPQIPYFTHASLKAQICMPADPGYFTDSKIEKIIQELHLQQIVTDTEFKEKTKSSISCCSLITQLFTEIDKKREFEPETSSLFDRIPVKDWYSSLSPGQQQLVAFSRIMFHHPKLVIIDEGTSALSPYFTGLVYATMKTSGIHYLSVSHDSTVEQYHDQVIELAGDGEKWSCRPAGIGLIN